MKQLEKLGRPPRILLVEDNPDDAKLTELAFRQAQVDVAIDVASSGERALAVLFGETETKLPDLILLDLNLPGTDGREVLRRVKEDSRLRRIPVIVLTTSEADVDLVLTYGLHANAFLSKPIGMDEWDDVIRGLTHFWFHLVKLPPDPR